MARKLCFILSIMTVFLFSSCSDPSNMNTSTIQSSDISSTVSDTKMQEAEFRSALKDYIETNFNQPGENIIWYPHIKSYEVHIGNQVVVSVVTDLKDDEVSGAFLGFLNDKSNTKYRADKVVVIDQNGNILSESYTKLRP
jgi:hypothetical protein